MAEIEEDVMEINPREMITQSYKEKIKHMSQISMWLDHYDDIFSDFDPRPYSQRALSDDFVAEAKKTIREIYPGKVELYLLIPNKERNSHHESTIKKRLKEYFKSQYVYHRDLKWKTINLGTFFVILGILFMFITAFILTKQEGTDFFITFLTVLMEPAGWFLLWEGMNLLVFKSKEEVPEVDFYRKMAECNFYFQPY